jgi:hypothetical protein
MAFDQKAIDELREALPEDEVIDLRSKEQKAADAEAATLWARRSEALGIDTKTAKYPELQAFVKEKAIDVDAQGKKAIIIAAIDAIDVELL